ncbi:adenylosuccinate lyase [Patescibacteria group bacterium]|nr:adenylosuccinate lyase [Patescibacteria group bacterium]MBU1758765.1 adenylosuccinate lyase [Patescibacteria group bacterium]
MDLNVLTAISPIDGRYREKVHELDMYFSEFALIRYRFLIEAEYFIALVEKLPQIKHLKENQLILDLRKRIEEFDLSDAESVKKIEGKINHDVKSVENFMRELLHEYPKEREFVHFALTSFDTDGMARPLMLKDAHHHVMMAPLRNVVNHLMKLSESWGNIPFLARTHGQPASPTKLGKEMFVFVDRLNVQMKYLNDVLHTAKLGGATGNFNAHYVAYPGIRWDHFADEFVEKLCLYRSQVTTQIEPYDNVAAYCHAWMRINTILIDLCRDMWGYIMLEQIKQKPKDGEVGSSTMPHKINPIDFENAEGNFGMANALFAHFADKLPISRLQRDLSDSTVIRNMGVPLAHTLIALKAIMKAFGKVAPNIEKINADLDNNWAVISEAIQTILRREGYLSSYDVLKELTRTGEKITKEALHVFIDLLKVDDSIKDELKAITPWNYTGI